MGDCHDLHDKVNDAIENYVDSMLVQSDQMLWDELKRRILERNWDWRQYDAFYEIWPREEDPPKCFGQALTALLDSIKADLNEDKGYKLK